MAKKHRLKLLLLTAAVLPMLVACDAQNQDSIDYEVSQAIDQLKQKEDKILSSITKILKNLDSTIVSSSFEVNDENERILVVHSEGNEDQIEITKYSVEDTKKIYDSFSDESSFSNYDPYSSSVMGFLGPLLIGGFIGSMMNNASSYIPRSDFNSYREHQDRKYTSSASSAVASSFRNSFTNSSVGRSSSGSFSSSARASSFGG